MKNIFLIFACLSLAFAGLGCQNTKSKATEGAVVGGVLGAGAGAIIGSVAGGHAGAGAGIGAAVGALAGGVIGAQMPKEGEAKKDSTTTTSQVVNEQQMSIQQVVDMSKQGVSDALIIDKITFTKSKFTLTEADVKYLKGQGVSQKVLDVMQGK